MPAGRRRARCRVGGAGAALTGTDRDDGDDDLAPDHRVEYVDEPIREDGSGFVVPVAGDAWLSISLQGASGYRREPPFRETYEGSKRMSTPRLDNVLELVSTKVFEAVMSWHAGVRTPEPSTVRTLRAPARIVVDVRQP